MNSMRIILLAWIGGAAQLTVAHAEISESVPADRAILATAPENVMLRFSEAVRLTALSVQGDGAAKQSLGPLPSDSSEQFSIGLPPLENGHYVVVWRALSEDTQVTTGQLMFAVGPVGNHDEHMRHGNDAEHSPGAHHDEHAGSH